MTNAPSPSPVPGSAPQDVASAAAVDRVCVDFEDQWSRGAVPDLGQWLIQLDASLRTQLFDELLAIELVYRRRRGEAPRAEDYRARFPEMADGIGRAFASDLSAAVLFAPGEVVGRYAIERELGRGSFGTVYLASDQQLDRKVALKIPGSQLVASQADVARLVEEVRTAARLQHPGIVPIYDVQPLPDQRLYAVMQYVRGCTLREYLQQQRPPAEIGRILAQVADALAYAHRQGFVHRDLTPDNILLDEQATPHITDFGLAIHHDERSWRSGEMAGSWAYMAPEQVRGDLHRLDGRADLWALGVILYEACTGHRPFTGETAADLRTAILQHSPRPPRQWNPAISPALDRVCMQCLAKEPEDRFAAAGDLAMALRATTRPPISQTTLLGALLVLVLASLLLVTGGVWYSLDRPPGDSAGTASLLGARPAELTIWVWRRGAWNRASTADGLPLSAGDQVRLTLEAAEPAYFYVLWIDVHGQLAGVYPWQGGDWSTRGTESAIDRLRLPSDEPDEAWTMEADVSGLEVVLVLGRETPLPADFAVAELLADLPQLAAPQAPCSLRFDYERVELLAQLRSIDPSQSRRVRDPLLELQTLLRHRLQPHFPWLEGAVISVERGVEEPGRRTGSESRVIKPGRKAGS